MRHESFDGLVIRVRPTGDHDVLLTVLTAERGRLSVLSKGSKSLKGEQRAVSQLFTYANFEVYFRGELSILKGGTTLHPFYGLSNDLDRISLGSYLCDVAYDLTDEGEPADGMLRLLLNSLYAINEDRYPMETVKSAYEWRAAMLSGYAPDLSGCSVCKTDQADPFYLNVMNGAFLCGDCMRAKAGSAKQAGIYDEIREAELLLPLSPSALAAARYVALAPPSRLFAFDLKDKEEMRAFSRCTEQYLLSHLGHGFDTLEFYRSICDYDTKGTKL